MLDPERVSEIMRVGNAAREMLATPHFADVLNALFDFHQGALVACPPGPKHSETRDHHHLMLHALREIDGEVHGRVQAVEQLQADLEAEQNDPANEE